MHRAAGAALAALDREEVLVHDDDREPDRLAAVGAFAQGSHDVGLELREGKKKGPAPSPTPSFV
jgi:hypothetical protein